MSKPKLFISYITEELELAMILKTHLENVFQGMIEIFVSSDDASLPVGAKWLERIDSVLKESKIELIICSNQSVTRPWINFEFGAGWIKGIPVVPVCHSGLQHRDLPSPLNALNAIEANKEADIKKLYSLIAKTLECEFPSGDPDGLVKNVKDFEGRYISKNDSPDFDAASLFDVLKRLALEPVTNPLPDGKDPFWEKNSSGIKWSPKKKTSRDWVEGKIREAEYEICIISYSFTTYKDEYGEAIEEFLRKGRAELRVLMLDPELFGFYKKTSLEAFRPELEEKKTSSETFRPDLVMSFEAWETATLASRDKHKKDIETSISYLNDWKRYFGEDKVEFALYPDTPNLNGLMFDRKAICFSSYFINPFSRGFNNPALLIEDISVHPNLIILQSVFRHWFEVTLATGRRV